MAVRKQSHAVRGYLFAACAAIMWGFSGVVTKFLLCRQMSPDELLVFRTLLAAIILLIWLGISAPHLLRIRRTDLPYFALLGGIGLVINQGAYYLALSRVSVGYALLIQYLAPVFLMIYGVLSKTERMTGGKVMAASLSLSGSILMVLGQDGGITRVSLSGTLFSLASALGFSFYAAYANKGMGRYDLRTIMTYAFLSAGLIWITIRPLWTLPWGNYDFPTWGFFIYLATVATVIPFGLFLVSLRYLEPSRSSLTSMLEPVVAAIVAWLWLGETLEPWQIVGGAGVLSGILLLQFESFYTAKRKRDYETNENNEINETD